MVSIVGSIPGRCKKYFVVSVGLSWHGLAQEKKLETCGTDQVAYTFLLCQSFPYPQLLWKGSMISSVEGLQESFFAIHFFLGFPRAVYPIKKVVANNKNLKSPWELRHRWGRFV